jgi:hypothetical protein
MSISNKTWMITKVLLICGILSSLLCIGTDILAAISWEGYSYTDRAASELTAIGAPTRPFVVPLLIVCQVLLIAFGTGVLGLAGKRRALHTTAILLVIFGVVSLISFFFPLHLPGAQRTLTDTMHLVFGGMAVLLMILFIGFGAAARGNGFRIYSILTILAILVFGAWAGLLGPQEAAGLPSPWFGVIERVSYYAPFVWVLVLAVVLLRHWGTAPQDN